MTSPIRTGTSTSGPITAANAAPCAMPNVATATAMASSKLFEAAVKESVAVWPYEGSDLPAHEEGHEEHEHEVDRGGIAIRTTSSGTCTIVSPLSENITTIVNRSATR